MSYSIELSERAARVLATIAAEQGIPPENYIRRFIEAWADNLGDEERDPDQAWFWTPEWQAGECAADADIPAGRGTVYESDEAFLKALEGRIGQGAEGSPDADA